MANGACNKNSFRLPSFAKHLNISILASTRYKYVGVKKCMELSDLAFEIEAQAVPGQIWYIT